MLQSTEDSVDCQGLQDELGMRCLKRKADRWPECVPMTCSDAGKVIIDGKPCNPGAASPATPPPPLPPLLAVMLCGPPWCSATL